MHRLDVFIVSVLAVVCLSTPPHAPRRAKYIVRAVGVVLLAAAIALVRS